MGIYTFTTPRLLPVALALAVTLALGWKTRTLFLPPAALAQTACGNGLIRGAYAFGADGTAAIGGQTVFINEIGRMDFDGSGKLTFVATVVAAGQSAVVNGTGTYEVGTDCTCTAKYTSPVGDGMFDFVVVNRGNDIVYMDTTAAVVAAGTMSKLFN